MGEWIVGGSLEGLTLLRHERSRAATAENPTGAKGAGGQAASPLGVARKGRPCLFDVQPGRAVTLADIDGPGAITHIWFTMDEKTSPSDCFVLRDLVLRMYWDGEETPSVEVPLGDFFCCGFARACVVNSAAVCAAPNRGFNCYWRMPFARHARITVENQHANAIPALFYQIDYTLIDDGLPADTAYFHAQWRRQPVTDKGHDYVVLDGVRGRGHYVGTYLALTTLERYWWGEGEMKFFIDGDDEWPTICGTGTEDYFGGAWSFAHQEDGRTVEQTYCMPYIGYPYYSRHDKLIHNDYHNDDVPPQRGFYRWHIPDPIRFDHDLKVTLQQIGVGYRGLFERQDDVATVAYWYQSEPHAVFPTLPDRESRWPR